MKGYVQEPETSDFKTEGWGEGLKTNYNLKTKTEGRGEATEFILIILPLPLGEGRGEGVSKSLYMVTHKALTGLSVQVLQACYWYFPDLLNGN